MRARLSWLALIPFLVLAGCRTIPGDSADGEPLSVADCNFAEALAHYSQAIISELTLGGAEESLRQSRFAAEKDPSNLDLGIKAGAGYLARKEYPQAIASLLRTLSYHSDSLELNLLLGMAYQGAGDSARAARCYGRAIALRPDRAEGYLRQAALDLGRDREDRAVAVLSRGLDKASDPATLLEFLDNLGRIHVYKGEAREAIRCFEPVAVKTPRNAAVRELLGRCYAEIGKTEKAVAELTAAMELQPSNARLPMALGDIAEDAGDTAKAIEFHGRAVQCEKTDPHAFVRLASLLLQSDVAQAVAVLKEGARRFPDDFRVEVFLGLIHAQQRQYKEAIARFSAVEARLAAHPEDAGSIPPGFYYWYGSACEQTGQYEKAERLLETVIEKAPDSDEALNYLAYMWAEKGVNLDRAMDYVTRALKIEPDDPAYIDTLGWIHFKRGDYPAALKALRRACDLLPDDPVVTDHVGDAWHALKNEQKAVEYWKRSFRLKPDNPAVRGKLRAAGVELPAAESGTPPGGGKP